jgi:hypothetical protein
MQAVYFASSAQGHGFKFGQFSYDELNMKVYLQDSSAAAVVLNEFGEAYFDSGGDHNLMFEYHAKIKILKKEGLGEGDFIIRLYKKGENEEFLRSIEASTFTLVNGSAVETKFDKSKIMNDKVTKNWICRNVALSNVQVGSVIEIMYKTESPFDFQFHEWEFQSGLPKVKSEYWAYMPANYTYNITIRGPLQLTRNETERVRDCWTPAGNSADCIHSKWGMQNIPAFIKEEYMTAPSNFKSAIRFELSEYRGFYGEKRKFTEEWKDVEERYRRSEKFGLQLKKGDNVLGKELDALLLNENDPLIKAKKIYDFIKASYIWNETLGDWCEFGISKAYENKKGNVADINLALVSALQYASLDADPMVLSTRANGLVTELHPVMSDFNYVVAKLNIGDKVYLLDATEDPYPFGVLPIRCMNGKGRVLDNENGSYWFEIKPNEKNKDVVMLNLKLSDDGSLSGTISKTYMGYSAIDQRDKIKSFSSQKEYINDFDNKWSRGIVKNFTIENVDDITKPIIEKLEVELEGIDDIKAPIIFFSPFIVGKLTHNPFKSKERLYPVDYGVPQDDIMILTLELPASVEISELPAKVGLALPNGGGRYIYDVQVNGNRMVINSTLSIAKPVFSSEEYHYLKELYDRILQVQNADLVLKPKAK